MQEFNPIDVVQKLFKHESLLDTLIEFERFLDNFHIYSYLGWFEGQVVAGPKIERYWITVTLMFRNLPDPAAAMALAKHGCKIRFKQGQKIEPVEVKSPDDYRPGIRKPKMKKNPVWFFEVSVPRRFIDEIDLDDLGKFDAKINADDVEAAEDENLEDEGFER